MPRFIRPCLWSYDVRRLDVVASAETIITQVLNYGNWRMVRWVIETYGEPTIRWVISHPRRGTWFPQVLTLWLTVYRLTLPRWLRHAAIRELDPAKQDWRAIRRYMSWRRRQPRFRVARLERRGAA